MQRAAANWGFGFSPAEAAISPLSRGERRCSGDAAASFDRWLTAGVASAGAFDSVRGDDRRALGRGRSPASGDSVATFTMLVGARALDSSGSAARRSPIRSIIDCSRRSSIRRSCRIAPRRQLRRDRGAPVDSPRPSTTCSPVEKIIGANEVVGREQNEKLRALHDAVDRVPATDQRSARRIVGSISFDFLLIALLGLTLVVFRPAVYVNFRWLLMVAIVATLVLFGGALVAQLRPVHPELVPVALAAVILSALFDRRISVIAAMVLATLVAGQSVYRGTNALFINLVGGAASRRSPSVRFGDAISRISGFSRSAAPMSPPPRPSD